MPIETPPKKNLIGSIRWLLLVGAIVALVYWIFAPKPESDSHRVSLSDLKGIWTTSSPQYQDRFLQFADSVVTFGWGETEVGSYIIDQIENHPDKESTLVRIHYIDQAKTGYQLNFYYVDQGGAMIWMKNQKGIYWFRTSDQPTHDPQFK